MVWCHHNNVLIHVLAISTVRVTTNADEDRGLEAKVGGDEEHDQAGVLHSPDEVRMLA